MSSKLKKSISVILCICLLFSASVCAFAANNVPSSDEWLAQKDDIFKPDGKISLTPGEKDGDINFSWVTVGTNTAFERFVYGVDPELSEPLEAEVTPLTTSSFVYTANRVSLKGLDSGTYYYNYTYKGEWQGVSSFRVTDASDGFSVMLCSDPQLGRSGSDSDEAVLDDAYGWDRTLKAAMKNCPDMSFILCAGDEVNMALSKKQYNALLYPEVLRSIPVAAAVGNHDFYSSLYDLHYNNPNKSDKDLASPGGNGYYFTYGNALFIVLNSNNYIVEDQRAIINTAVNSAPNAKWRVVMMHESLYFSGMNEKHQSKIDFFAPLFDEYNIDLVVSGHEHVYSRTAPMTADAPAENGVTYLAVSTASGCNFDSYDGCDSRVVKCENLSEPSYSVLDFGEDEINVKSYYTDKDEIFDEFTVTRVEKSDNTEDFVFDDWFGRLIKTILAAIALLFK